MGWVMARRPREMEKVIEMKITLGTWKECSITTDGEENPVSNQMEQIEMRFQSSVNATKCTVELLGGLA